MRIISCCDLYKHLRFCDQNVGDTVAECAIDVFVRHIRLLFLLYPPKKKRMHRIDTPTAQKKDKFGQGKTMTNGDPATGRRATDLNSDMWTVQKRSALLLKPPAYHSAKAKHGAALTPPRGIGIDEHG